MGRANLRAVADGEKPAEKPPTRQRPLTAQQAASQGKRRELIVAMQTRVAKAVDDPLTPPRDLAALTRRLLELSRELESIDLEEQDEERGDGHVEDEAFDASAI